MVIVFAHPVLTKELSLFVRDSTHLLSCPSSETATTRKRHYNKRDKRKRKGGGIRN